jgi:dUTP pyrophosphatase
MEEIMPIRPTRPTATQSAIKEIKILRLNKDLPLPKYQTPEAAGMDLYANVDRPIKIKSGERILIPTGIKVQLPNGFEMQIRPRSGLALKSGVTVLNAPATLDADYRGEIGVILINHGNDNFTINKGERIAQGVINRIYNIIPIVEVNELDETIRGEGGFGSTGIK